MGASYAIGIRLESDWAAYVDSGSCTELLCYLKNRAQVFLGCEVTDATISVPCEWSLDFWKTIRASAKKAGFRRVRLIPGPTAEAVRNAEQMRREGKEVSFLQVDIDCADEGISVPLYRRQCPAYRKKQIRFILMKFPKKSIDRSQNL